MEPKPQQTNIKADEIPPEEGIDFLKKFTGVTWQEYHTMREGEIKIDKTRVWNPKTGKYED